MTFSEIREALPMLRKDERAELIRDLQALAWLDDPAYVVEMTKLLDEIDAGTAKLTTDLELKAILADRRRAAA